MRIYLFIEKCFVYVGCHMHSSIIIQANYMYKKVHQLIIVRSLRTVAMVATINTAWKNIFVANFG